MVPVRLQVGLTKPIKDETSELQPNAVEIETLLMGSLYLSLSLSYFLRALRALRALALPQHRQSQAIGEIVLLLKAPCSRATNGLRPTR